MLLEPFMGVINSGMVGRLGTQQLGAVSVASLVVSFATFLFSFLMFLTTPEIAAAVSKGDKAEVSRISARGFWLAGGLGAATTTSLVLGGPWVISLMAPPEPAVAAYATQYIGVRAWGMLAALLGFVATGTYRGFKDTRTPLYVAMGSAALSLLLNYTFICVFQWGVAGAALAVTLAQASSATALCGLLVAKGMLQLKDLLAPPAWSSVSPLLRRGSVLALRNIISMGARLLIVLSSRCWGMVLYASMLCVRAGSVYQASFEVLRQVWIVAIQCFECLNVATQSLCATYLGSGDRASAEAVLQRLLLLGVLVGGAVGVAVFLAQSQVTGFFTTDTAVISQVLSTLPLVALLFPLDAAASIMDGSLLAAKQTDYMSVVQKMLALSSAALPAAAAPTSSSSRTSPTSSTLSRIGGSALQYACLLWLAANSQVSSLTIWATLKLLAVVRVGGGVYRTWLSPASAYKPALQPAAASTAGDVGQSPPSHGPSQVLSAHSPTNALQTPLAPSHAVASSASSTSNSEGKVWQQHGKQTYKDEHATETARSTSDATVIRNEALQAMSLESQQPRVNHPLLARHSDGVIGDGDATTLGAAQQGIPLLLVASEPAAETQAVARSHS
ncbi:hypothetical protein QJQ45_001287 [Haematococcus lacustris]|nr:hypothetical protein QJQ45_001287 [Haematococcus lacustris]